MNHQEVQQMLKNAKDDEPQQFYEKVLTAIDNTLSITEYKQSIAILASMVRRQEEGELTLDRKGVYVALQQAIKSEQQYKKEKKNR